MRRLLGRLLWNEHSIGDYAAIQLRSGPEEYVFLETGGRRLDISNNQWLLCLYPMVLGIWMTREQADQVPPEMEVIISNKLIPPGGRTPHRIASMRLITMAGIEENNGILVIGKIAEARLHHFAGPLIRFQYLMYHKKQGIDFGRFSSYAAAFSYPRKVRLVSAGAGDHQNIFPMDFVGELSSHNRFVFGLRHTNRSMTSILTSRRIVVSEIAGAHKQTLYELGANHRSPPARPELGFPTFRTRHFDLPVPEWIDQYREVRIIRHLDLGSHMLLWGEVVNHQVLQESGTPLYHIHFLQYLYRKKGDTGYQRIP